MCLYHRFLLEISLSDGLSFLPVASLLLVIEPPRTTLRGSGTIAHRKGVLGTFVQVAVTRTTIGLRLMGGGLDGNELTRYVGYW